MSRERVASAVLQLLADDTQFKAGLSSAEKSAKTFQDRIGEVGKNMTRVGGAIAGFGVAAGASLLAVAQSAATFGDELQKSSIRTGVSTEALQGLKFAAEQSGSRFESLTKGLKALSKNSNEANLGMKEYSDTFDRLGVSVADTNGNLKEADVLLLELADAISGLDNDTEALALAQEVFGKSGADLLPLLKEGREGIEALAQQGRDLGIVYSQDLADASAEYLDAQNELTTSVKGLRDAVGVELIPVLNDLTDSITPLIQKTREWVQENPKMVLGIGAIVAAIAGSGGLVIVLGGLAIAAGAVTAPILAITAAIVGAGGAVFAIVRWKDEIVDAAETFIRFKLGLDAAKPSIADLTEGMVSFATPAGIMADKLELQAEKVEAVTEAVTEAVPAIGAFLDKWDFERQLAETAALSGSIRELSRVDLPDLGLVTTNVFAGMLTAVKQYNAEAKADFMGTNIELRDQQEATNQERTESDLEVLEASKENLVDWGDALTTAVGNSLSKISGALTDVIFDGENFGAKMVSIFKNLAKGITEILIDGALTKLAAKITEVVPGLGSLFGGAGASAAGNAAGGAAGGAIGGAAGGAFAGIGTGIVSGGIGAIGGIVGGLINRGSMKDTAGSDDGNGALDNRLLAGVVVTYFGRWDTYIPQMDTWLFSIQGHIERMRFVNEKYLPLIAANTAAINVSINQNISGQRRRVRQHPRGQPRACRGHQGSNSDRTRRGSGPRSRD